MSDETAPKLLEEMLWQVPEIRVQIEARNSRYVFTARPQRDGPPDIQQSIAASSDIPDYVKQWLYASLSRTSEAAVEGVMRRGRYLVSKGIVDPNDWGLAYCSHCAAPQASFAYDEIETSFPEHQLCLRCQNGEPGHAKFHAEIEAAKQRQLRQTHENTANQGSLADNDIHRSAEEGHLRCKWAEFDDSCVLVHELRTKRAAEARA